MGLWSKIKKGVKKIVNTIRKVVKAITTAIYFVLFFVVELLLILFPPTKKLRYYVYIMSDENGKPLAQPSDVEPSIREAKRILKDKFNVELIEYHSNNIDVKTTPSESGLIDFGDNPIGWKIDQSEAGDFFNKNMAGTNYSQFMFNFPVTFFIVRNIKSAAGLAVTGPLSDYIIIDAKDINGVHMHDPQLFAHELGHSCNLWHSKKKNNLMYENTDNGEEVKWGQKKLFRLSRHTQYW